ncbi:hypothetical protein PtA15_1A500 [Puccinia triticina]|uniref:Stealth protein CR3 conserved region 3 domain-containing protein n=2 Tax=Puccinia triticina TaxID=208348 RepID=A0ABY7CAH0_9BASI|nr:uncharacterized protein PtA15_1A500 [Puccinia triticina]WAQ81161.1 hypothetical protein PtA15_1A500 [Puccinia triticina]
MAVQSTLVDCGRPEPSAEHPATPPTRVLVFTMNKPSSAAILITTTLCLYLWLIQHHHQHPAQTDPLKHASTDRRPPRKPAALHPTAAQRLPTRMAHAWLAQGILPPAAINSQPIDLLWTWANDSAPSDTVRPSSEPDPTAYLYRQHDELRFSLRSSLQSLPPAAVRSRIIITPDEPNPPSSGLPPAQQARPHWLVPTPDQLNPKQSHQPVSLTHHSQIFRFINRRQALQAFQWLKNYLPSHNSMAIESQFGHLDGIQDNFLYLNDDCFFINKFNLGDFSSELFGPVFRIQFDLKVQDDPEDHSGTVAAQGEWPSLGYSNHLLSLRFGRRERRYLSHLPKVINFQILREVSEIWSEEIFLTASSRVRGQGQELNMMFLATWYHIEKHREAMLHSFIMLQTDSNRDGQIDAKERAKMMTRLGAGQGSTIDVRRPFRPRGGAVEDGLGTARPAETDYEWLSSDGYPFAGEAGKVADYRHVGPATGRGVCQLNLTACFPAPPTAGTERAESVLRRVASEQPGCGDCLLALLVGKRPAGIDALLPPASLRTRLAELARPAALVSTPFSSAHKRAPNTAFYSSPFPRLSRFSRRGFLADDPRIWAIRNIQRYQYVLGHSPNTFDALTTISSSRMVLDRLSEQFDVKPATNSSSAGSSPSSSSGGARGARASAAHRAMLVTINDRIFGPHLDRVHHLFTTWLNTSWPTPAPWEKN